MRRHGIRRLPILDRQGVLLGIVAVDDYSNFWPCSSPTW
ncbi:MAG: hypothetical protein JO108_06765 [Acidobacteriaceae bacterium]|nr:hypothetical protein [Acidobacteriaceae bacterium]